MGKSRVDARVMESRVSLLAQAVGAALRLGLPRALRHFAAEAARAAG